MLKAASCALVCMFIVVGCSEDAAPKKLKRPPVQTGIMVASSYDTLMVNPDFWVAARDSGFDPPVGRGTSAPLIEGTWTIIFQQTMDSNVPLLIGRQTASGEKFRYQTQTATNVRYTTEGHTRDFTAGSVALEGQLDFILLSGFLSFVGDENHYLFASNAQLVGNTLSGETLVVVREGPDLGVWWVDGWSEVRE